MNLLVEAIGFGLVTAAILTIASVGFTLQLGIANIFNLAYGFLMTASAFVAYLCNTAGLNIWLCLVVATTFGAGIAPLLNYFVFAPFRRRGTQVFGMVIVTLAVGLLGENLMLAVWGPSYFTYSLPEETPIRFASIVITKPQLTIIGLAFGAMLVLHVILTRTKLGKAMRATAADTALASARGIPTSRIVTIVWALAGGLCGMAGVALALNTVSFNFSIGTAFMIEVVAAAILGGAGQPYGAMLGALLIGLVSEVSATFYNPANKNLVAFVILVVVILIRPQGIVGSAQALATTREEVRL